MEKLKIVLVSSEVAPFAKTGGLADVAGSLPLALKGLGCDIKVFLPYYRQAKKQDFGIKLFKKNIITKVGSEDINFSLYHCEKENVDFYFIEKDDYYDRDFLYGTSTSDYPDNAMRFAFFASAVLSSIVAMNFKPDVIHCNDWQTALIPFDLRNRLQNVKVFKNTHTLFTIHNLAYQGLFARDVAYQLGIGDEFFTPDTLEFYGKLSFMKSGILYSDAVSTVSRGYSHEILTPEFGCGLDGLLNIRRNDLYGIVNGVNYSDWDPKIDKNIKANYDETNLGDKAKCKKDLLSLAKLKSSLEAPLLGVITRLAEQKGIDIIADSIEEIIGFGCNLVILGMGDEKYHNLLTELSKKYPKNIAVKIGFDNVLAHKIEAGCDMFLMPSRFEPCGLNQMYSLKYGTIPIVRAVGGLDDTITDYTQNKREGNGFKFNQANKDDFMNAFKRALSTYKNKKEWEKLVLKVMGLDFSWEQSAKEYTRVYKTIMKVEKVESCCIS
ncbi:MAG: glycogen synthase GlgA [Candidatus Omnitrophica bacterium CG07_land_8_20_14_0_80_42_15]|uniref:Glycogen synthase n=1 Tax=Candidatus Aquitaenariimonas noxiae TaxID=1974741 RepID=A0A2J0KVD3_9BACT|nr:MAG: glycogen synthase GlgA [Candidatus Omnitrophica bacterium CG07_land_8_20_14_0_80_42_15]